MHESTSLSVARSQAQNLELTLLEGFQCRLLSGTFDWFQDNECCVAYFGTICYQSQTINADRLAQIYLERGDIASLYDQLRGRFWLLLFDAKRRSLHLVNDHLGLQPCYYTMQNGILYVSDSLKPIKNCKSVQCSLSDQAIFNYLYFHCIPSPDTIYKECSKLEPGKSITFSADGETRETQLYKPQFANQAKDPEQLQKRCLDLIDSAVARCVTPDCGAFLSGGLDSSTVAGMLAKHQSAARTFSIGFDAPDYDETPFAKITAEHFGTKHHVLYLKAEDAAEEFVRVVQYFDEPFGNSSAMAAYFCAKFARSNGVASLLAGDGGDELFAGNSRYAKQKQFELFHRAPKPIQSAIRTVFTNTLVNTLPMFRKAASYIQQADVPLPERLETYNFVEQFGAEEMFHPDFFSRIDCQQPATQQKTRYHECDSTDPVDRMLYLDWKFTLADNDLVKVTKMCELAGVAVHFPLLDREVVDFSCQVPAHIKLPGYKLRDFYKQACRGFLADRTLTKSKHGFGLPFGVWMKENKKLLALTMESLKSFRARNIVSDTLIDNALRAHASSHAGYYGELIWIMVTLELWLQENN